MDDSTDDVEDDDGDDELDEDEDEEDGKMLAVITGADASDEMMLLMPDRGDEKRGIRET